MLTNHVLSAGVVVAIGTLFVGKSAAQLLSSSNNVVTAITLTIISLHYIVPLHCYARPRLVRWAWRAAIEVH
jgi:hypothetical protein